MHLSASQIHEAVSNPDWQRVRVTLKGRPTELKLTRLASYLEDGHYAEERLVQVQNYLNALARGGQIEPTNKAQPVDIQIKNAKVRR